MSAQVAALPDRIGASPAPRPRRDHLAAVAPRPRLAARYPFMMVLAVVLGLGMVGLLLLNTMIQSQARELDQLQNQATGLSYQQAALTTQVQQLRSSSALQQKAYALGMRPNPTPAFIVLPEGKILGTPTKVSGNELPIVPTSWQQQQSAQEAARAKVAQAAAKKKADELAKKKAADAAAKKKADAAAKKKVDPAKQTTTPPAGPTGGR